MLRLDNLKFSYSQTSFCFNFRAAAGESIAIVGPSGAGKSTLLNLIAGFITPISGELYLADRQQPVTTVPAQRPVSMLFQEHNLFMHLSVSQNIALGVRPDLRLSATEWQEVQKIAATVGIAEVLSKLPEQLSVGQRQRVALARCLLRRKPILLLDEPFSMLDPPMRSTLKALIQQIRMVRQLTILMVSHHLEDIAHIAPRTLVITNGEIVYDGATVSWLTEQDASCRDNRFPALRDQICPNCQKNYRSMPLNSDGKRSGTD